MVTVISQRAKSLLDNPKAFLASPADGMRKYPGESFKLWVQIESAANVVKKLSFFGEVESWKRVLLESMASLMIGKDLARLEQLSLRECEAYLRDRNSELALEGMPKEAEEEFRKFFHWVRGAALTTVAQDYSFLSEKGPFRNLKLADKVRELKGFLNSPEVATIYQGLPLPELVDVEELDVFLQIPWQTEREKVLLEELHALGVETFQEENLNFIPEA